MVIEIMNKIISAFKNLDKKIIKILNFGLKFCLAILVLSSIILITYLFFIHNDFIFQIGLLTFQIGICFIAEFFTSAITVDFIYKHDL